MNGTTVLLKNKFRNVFIFAMNGSFVRLNRISIVLKRAYETIAGPQNL